MSLSAVVKEKVFDAFKKCGFDDAPTLVRLSDRPDMSDYLLTEPYHWQNN